MNKELEEAIAMVKAAGMKVVGGPKRKTVADDIMEAIVRYGLQLQYDAVGKLYYRNAPINGKINRREYSIKDVRSMIAHCEQYDEFFDRLTVKMEGWGDIGLYYKDIEIKSVSKEHIGSVIKLIDTVGEKCIAGIYHNTQFSNYNIGGCNLQCSFVMCGETGGVKSMKDVKTGTIEYHNDGTSVLRMGTDRIVFDHFIYLDQVEMCLAFN